MKPGVVMGTCKPCTLEVGEGQKGGEFEASLETVSEKIEVQK